MAKGMFTSFGALINRFNTWAGNQFFTNGITVNGTIDFSNGSSSFGFVKMFESSQQTITSAGSLTIAHSLPAKPKLIYGELVCQTAEAGFSVGDIYGPFIMPSTGSTAQGMSVRCDATNLYVRFGSYGYVFWVDNNTTGDAINLTNANWKLVLRAWG